MALVHVEDGRLEAERAQRADAADAEDELLPEPVLAVAAVEPVGDRARLGRVPLDVGVEQVEARPADVGAPDAGGNGLARELDLDLDRLGLDRQPRRVVRRVALLLAARLVELLAEVALAVEQADADERHAELGRPT